MNNRKTAEREKVKLSKIFTKCILLDFFTTEDAPYSALVCGDFLTVRRCWR